MSGVCCGFVQPVFAELKQRLVLDDECIDQYVFDVDWISSLCFFFVSGVTAVS